MNGKQQRPIAYLSFKEAKSNFGSSPCRRWHTFWYKLGMVPGGFSGFLKWGYPSSWMVYKGKSY